MKSETFINTLREAKPTIESLLDAGLSEDEAAEIRSSFEISPRPSPQSYSIPDDQFSELFTRNDLSHVEIGMVRFSEQPKAYASGWVIGQVEADYLTLDASTGEVLVRDISSIDHVVWRCAKDGASFLDALAPAAQYLGECITSDLSGTERQLVTLEACVANSGGDAYRSFYEMLLGVE